MRAVIQRVLQTIVQIDQKLHAKIGKGMLILIGIEDSDTSEDINWLSGKISRLRIFNDEKEVMNLSVSDVNGEIVVVSQFTLHASTKKGNRPSYIRAAKPETAVPLYEEFIRQLEKDSLVKVQSGKFGSDMKISLINDGPVTILIDTKKKE